MLARYRHLRIPLSMTGLLILSLLLTHPVHAVEKGAVHSDDGTEITFRRYPGHKSSLFIWLPSEDGLQPAERRVASELAAQGHENWLVDLFESRFLPTTASSLDQVPAQDVAALIDRANPQTRQVFLISSGRGTGPLLRGLHVWQRQHPQTEHTPGVILISPQFYHQTPDPGEPAQLLPVVPRTNAALFILQPANSPWRWKLNETLAALSQSGSDVYWQLLPEVRDRFYYRPDATDKEQQLENRLIVLVRQAAQAIVQWPQQTRSVEPLNKQLEPLPASKQERELKPYAGDPQPPPLQLPRLDGKRYDLADYHGKVVLVNFWASWCPPCVHEMPSMERLQNRLYNKPFTILAVNMAEKPVTINEFLQTKVSVTFPILLDRDGKALQEWGVFAFPTSYLIDKQGQIRYALFGSVDWEQDTILSKINTLVTE